MVRSDVQIGSCSTQTVFTIEPNRNLSWKQSKRLLFFLSGCVTVVSLYFASLGAWLVLPFGCLEVLFIGGAIYLQSCCAHRRQVIRVGRKKIEIRDSGKADSTKIFPKAWSSIVQIRDRKGWYPCRLLIGTHGEYVEIGKHLMEDERESLANQLRYAIGRT
jgi:uncharacterized membrane protein